MHVSNNTIRIKKYKTNKILFTHTENDNTLLKTLLAAMKDKVDLSYAGLDHEDFSNFEFKDLILDHAVFTGSNLVNTVFTNCSLVETDFRKTKT